MDDGECAALQEAVKYSRYWCIKTFVKFSALSSSIEAFKTELNAIEKLKKPLVENAVPDYKDVEKYVMAINKVFVKGIAGELLTKAQDVYNDYKG